jgi:polar amino acid transport system substrate-binding protein
MRSLTTYATGLLLLAALSSGCGPDQPEPTPGPQIRSNADLADKRLGVMLGTFHDSLAREHFPHATIIQYESANDLPLAITTGKIDAAFSDRDRLVERLEENPQLAIIGEPLVRMPVAVGLRKGNTELLLAFNRFLAEIKSNGVHADMLDRWLVRRVAEMPDVRAADPSGEIIVGMSSSGALPFAAIKDGILIGLDVELAHRFAASQGRAVEFTQMPFGGLIAATATGKIDLLINSLFVTEERKQKIDFTDTYHEEDVLAYGLASNIAGSDASRAAAAAPVGFIDSTIESFKSNIIVEKRYLLLWDGLKATVLISILSTALGTLLGAVVCFMRMSPLRILSVPARAYITLFRGIPVLVLLMIIFYVVFAAVNLNPIIAAVIAFAVHFAAYVAEMFRSGIESIDRGQSEAGASLGFTPLQTFGVVIFPQMVQRILPVFKGEFIALVKMTSVVGYVAVQDLTKASDIIRSRTFDAFFPLVMVAVLYFLIATALLQALEYLERATDPQYRRRKAAPPGIPAVGAPSSVGAREAGPRGLGAEEATP